MWPCPRPGVVGTYRQARQRGIAHRDDLAAPMRVGGAVAAVIGREIIAHAGKFKAIRGAVTPEASTSDVLAPLVGAVLEIHAVAGSDKHRRISRIAVGVAANHHPRLGGGIGVGLRCQISHDADRAGNRRGSELELIGSVVNIRSAAADGEGAVAKGGVAGLGRCADILGRKARQH